jgi:hypothetical protein
MREEFKHLLDKSPELSVRRLIQHGWRCPGECSPISVLDSMKTMFMDVHVAQENVSAGSAPNILRSEGQRIGFSASRTSIQKRPSMNCAPDQMRDAPVPWNMDYLLTAET